MIPYLVSCTNDRGSTAAFKSDELAPYFLEVLPFVNPDPASNLVRVAFDDETNPALAENQTGLCIYSTKGSSIIIRRNTWNTAPRSFRLGLMAHEMLHCLNFLDHIEDPAYRDNKLMSPFTSDSQRCVLERGVQECIEEAYEMANNGTIERFR